jgi:hypothetical protein
VDFSKNGSELQEELSLLVALTQTTELPYTSSSTDTWDAVKMTDLVPGDTENVYLFYGYDDYDGISQTDLTRDKDLQQSSTCIGFFNREHVYARSIANPNLTTDEPGPGTDVHNLRACDCQMNSFRSNRLFEDGSGDSHVTVSDEWYPGDQWKGDVARIVMYMHIRYTSQTPANDIGTGANNYHSDMPDVFLDWNVEDPVSEYETQRNTVLESMQGNRNPFIDNPYLATKLWGGTAAVDTWGLLELEDPVFQNIRVYPTVVSDRLYISNTTSQDINALVYTFNGQEIKMALEKDYLDVSPLSNGLYFLRIFNDTSFTVFKFVKNR